MGYWAPPLVPSSSKRNSSSLSSLTKYCTCKLQILLLRGLHFSPSSACLPGGCWWCTALHPSLTHLLLLPCSSPHPFSLPLQTFGSLFHFSSSPPSTSESSYFSGLHHIPSLSSLTYTLIWLLTPSSSSASIWKSYPYETLPWMPLDPALFFFVSTLASLKVLLTNTVWSFLPNFKLLLQSLQVLKLHCTCMGIMHKACIFSANVFRMNKDHLDGNFQQTPCAQPQTAAVETSSWSFAKQMKIKFCDEKNARELK